MVLIHVSIHLFDGLLLITLVARNNEMKPSCHPISLMHEDLEHSHLTTKVQSCFSPMPIRYGRSCAQ